MSETKIGGFYAALGIKTDGDSFDKAHRAIEGTTNSINHFITAMKTAAAVMGIEKLTAMANQEMYTADAIGVSTEELDKWQVAATLAGVKASSLAASLGKLHNAFIDEERGITNESLIKDVTQLGLDWNSLREEQDASARLEQILGAASKMDNQGLALRLVESILGTDGRQMYQYMMKYYEGDVGKLLNKASLINLDTDDAREKSAVLQNQLHELKASVTQIAALGIGELSGPLTEIVKPLNEWLQSHGTEIAGAMKTLGDSLMSIISFFQTREEKQAELFANQKQAGLELAASGAKMNGGKYRYDQLSKEMQEKVAADPQAYATWLDYAPGYSVIEGLKYNFWSTIGGFISDGQAMMNGTYMNDGIISPTGQVTQVAPDDWVIAAKDLSNLGAAFMPQSMPTSGDIILNQTINVSGSTNAQMVRQQAYAGARNGMLDAMEQSTQRLQLMPQAR